MTPDEYPCETEEYKNACANMTPTPETLTPRDLLWMAEAKSTLTPEMRQHLRAAADEWEALIKQIEGMTAGGSEFVNNPERCLEDIRQRLAVAGKVAAERNALRTRLEAADEERASMKRMWDMACNETHEAELRLEAAESGRVADNERLHGHLGILEKVIMDALANKAGWDLRARAMLDPFNRDAALAQTKETP